MVFYDELVIVLNLLLHYYTYYSLFTQNSSCSICDCRKNKNHSVQKAGIHNCNDRLDILLTDRGS